MTAATDNRVGTLIHAADIHLGAPLQSLGARVGEEIAGDLRSRAARAFDDLVDLVLQEKAEILVLAGDVYDQAEYEVSAQLRLAQGLRRVTEHGVRVFIAHGNHDPLVASFQRAAELPDDVTVFDAGAVQHHKVSLRSGHEVTVAGISFGKTHETENLAALFRAESLDRERTVGVLHTNVGSNAQYGQYAPCTPTDLELAPVGYWALGHIHDRQVHQLGPDRWWAYPGNLQGRSTRATECGPKGALVVPILERGFGEPRFASCDRVRFERVSMDVSTCTNVDEAIEGLAELLGRVSEESGTCPVVARVRFEGATQSHRQLITTSDLLEIVRERVSSGVEGVVVAKVEVATRPFVTREQLLDRDNLQSALLHRMDRVRADGTDVMGLLGNFDPKARTRLEELLASQPDRVAEVLDSAEQILIDRFEGDS